MSLFSIQIDEQPGGMIAHLQGEATNAEADRLRDGLKAILKQRCLRVVLDLSELQFVASLSLGELIRFRRDLQTYGGELRLASARPNVEEVFRKTRLVELFPMYADPCQALTDSNPPRQD
jgi:anti-anti-sigma factor